MSIPIRFEEWGLAEAKAIFHACLTGSIRTGSSVQRLSNSIKASTGANAVYALNAGRTGIELALKTFMKRSPGKRKVLYPAYICPTVPATIRAAGCEPIPVDVGTDLNMDVTLLEEMLGGNCLAVIAAHMYGCPAEITRIEEQCKQAGVFLIDDSAQVMGIAVDGRALGTFGDVGIASFAQSKSIVTGVRGSGGALLVNNPALITELDEQYSRLPDATARLSQLSLFIASCVVAGRLWPSGGLLERLAGQLFAARPTDYLPARISAIEAAIAIAQLTSLEQRINTRKNTLHRYAECLEKIEGLQIPQFAPDRYLTRLMIQLPRAISLEKFRAALTSGGIRTRPGYYVAENISCPCAQTIAPRLLELPTTGSLAPIDIAHVASIVKHQLTK